jgi:hypothetical protein
MPDWVWQGIFTNWLSTLLVLAGGAVVAFLKARGSKFTSPILYGVGTSVLLMSLLLMVRIIGTLPPHRALVTPSNVQEKIQSWVDKFHFSVKKDRFDKAAFALDITGMNGKELKVAQLKDLDGYIVVSSAIHASPEHLRIMNSLNDELGLSR